MMLPTSFAVASCKPFPAMILGCNTAQGYIPGGSSSCVGSKICGLTTDAKVLDEPLEVRLEALTLASTEALFPSRLRLVTLDTFLSAICWRRSERVQYTCTKISILLFLS